MVALARDYPKQMTTADDVEAYLDSIFADPYRRFSVQNQGSDGTISYVIPTGIVGDSKSEETMTAAVAWNIASQRYVSAGWTVDWCNRVNDSLIGCIILSKAV